VIWRALLFIDIPQIWLELDDFLQKQWDVLVDKLHELARHRARLY